MDGEKRYLHAATSLVLRGWLQFPLFFRLTRRVIREMKGMDGLVGHDLRAELGKRRFMTLTVWSDRAALGRLMASQSHRDAARRFEEVGDEASVTTSWESDSPVLDWAEAERQLRENPRYPYRARR